MKRNICIVSFANPYLYPYFQTYIRHIEAANAKCTILYWNRYDGGDVIDQKIYSSSNLISFNKVLPIGAGGYFNKILLYIKATIFIRGVLKKQDFDSVIFTGSLLAILCKGHILKKYNRRYIIDTRDYSYENNIIYKQLQKDVYRNSYGNVISSPAYKNFLPEFTYYLAHNYSKYEASILDQFRLSMVHTNPICITYVGTVRFFEQDKKMLKLFANDNRFRICYYGSGSHYLENYAKANNIKNVDFKGSFSQSETIDLYKETSLINNLYGNHTPYLDFALSNKLYHAAQLYRPILVCPDTYMEEVALKYNIGIVVDVDNPLTPDILFEQYNAFDWTIFKKGCDEFIKQVETDNWEFNEFCSNFAKGL